MEITNELLAAYAEDKVTKEERNAVRQYLIKHPEELEAMLMLIDRHYDLKPQVEPAPRAAHSAPGTFRAMSYGSSDSVFESDNAVCGYAPLRQTAKSFNAFENGKTFTQRLDGLIDELGL